MSAQVGDIREVLVNYTIPRGRAQNTFGFECVTNVAGADQANLASAFRTAMVKQTSGGLLYGMANDCACDSIWVDDVKPGTLARYVDASATVAGSSIQADLPPQCAVLYSLKTALKGRSYRGRFYLPGPVQTDETDGAWSAGAITAYTTILTQLLAVFGPAGSNGDWRLGVISRFSNKQKRAQPIITQVTSISLDPLVATQRPRRS